MFHAIRYILFVFFMFLSLFFMIPVAIIRPFNPKNNALYFQLFKNLLRIFGLFKLHIEGENILKENMPCVVSGNHQHNFDVLSVADLFQHKVAVLGKSQLGFIPLFGQIYVMFGNMLIQRGNKKKAMKSMDILEQKIKSKSMGVLIFPEGTRNPNKELCSFKKGAFYTAIKCQIPIVPFSVSQFVAYSKLNTIKPLNIYVKVGEPIPTTGLTNQDIPKLMEMTKQAIEKGLIEVNKNY